MHCQRVVTSGHAASKCESQVSWGPTLINNTKLVPRNTLHPKTACRVRLAYYPFCAKVVAYQLLIHTMFYVEG